MKLATIGIGFVLLLVGCASPPKASTPIPVGQGGGSGQTLQWRFDADRPGEPPPGAEVFSGTWAVRAELGSASPPNALCQTATAEFPAMTLSPIVYANVEMTARFRPVSGQNDQAAGLIVRVQDANDYYILRANALEGNVNLYKFVGGQRSSLKDGKAPVPSGEWQELRVEAVGNRLRGFLNRERVVEATDDTFTTGRVGLWTKADSVTCFDDVEVKAT